MKKVYRLHFEGETREAEKLTGMKAVRDTIREEAKKAGITIKKATDYAYIMTEEEYQEEQKEV